MRRDPFPRSGRRMQVSFGRRVAPLGATAFVPRAHDEFAYDLAATSGSGSDLLRKSRLHHLLGRTTVEDSYSWGQSLRADLRNASSRGATAGDRERLHLIRDAAAGLFSRRRVDPKHIRPFAGNFVILRVDSVHVFLAHLRSGSLALTRATSPRLILMDLQMPLMDGWETTRLRKAGVETAHIPIIAVTAEDHPGSAAPPGGRLLRLHRQAGPAAECAPGGGVLPGKRGGGQALHRAFQHHGAVPSRPRGRIPQHPGRIILASPMGSRRLLPRRETASRPCASGQAAPAHPCTVPAPGDGCDMRFARAA
jgi:CheY-like chemotaxis protein